MILGTAGHIDHGKTSLVRALTGVDTDRLPEEKRRGITIELGFAPLELPGIGTLSIVDVPGHEAFVRTMVAGATGIDVAMLVIAADEGVMPQTREHLAILTLLGIPRGVIALTKCDLADQEWMTLVEEEVRTLVHDTRFAAAPIIRVSSTTGAGLDALRTALGDAARAVPPRDAQDLFRLPVDRTFTVKGTGTVITGTVWSGSIAREGAVRVLPGDHRARVRGVQSHGASVEHPAPGTRTALALAGVDVADIPRGSTIVAHPAWRPTGVLLADLTLLDTAPAIIGPRTKVRVHVGTSDVGARLVASGGGLSPRDRRPVRIVLDAPIVARAGDPFVVRSASPAHTIGGGTITDPYPRDRRAKPFPQLDAAPSVRLQWLLRQAGLDGLARIDLPVRLGIPEAAIDETLAVAHGVAIGAVVIAASTLDEAMRHVVAHVRQGVALAPLEPGLSLQSVRGALRGDAEVIEAVIRGAVTAGLVDIEGGAIRPAGWSPALTAAQQAMAAALVARIAAAGMEPPSVPELDAEFATETSPLLRYLDRHGDVVPVTNDRYYTPSALDAAVALLRQHAAPDRRYAVAELRDLIGVSRKYLVPLLEYFDRTGVTERTDDGRRVNDVTMPRV